MAKKNNKGRNAVGRFIQISHWLMETPAWKSLNPTARCLYLELKKRYNGYNNGGIAFSEREAALLVGVVHKTIAKAFAALQDRGFIVATQKGSFGQKTTLDSYGRATRWLLTEYPQDLPESKKSLSGGKDFMRWREEPDVKNKPRTENLPLAEVKFTHAEALTEVKDTTGSGKKYCCETQTLGQSEVKNTAVYNIPSGQCVAPASGPTKGQAQQGADCDRLILKKDFKQADIFQAVGGFCKICRVQKAGIEALTNECAEKDRKVGEIRVLALKAHIKTQSYKM